MDRLVGLETLDTSFVNFGALIRYLRQRNFVGRVKVALEDYDADVFLDGAKEPSISERNHATGRAAQGKEAMDRLLVRARDPGGLITIYQQVTEAGRVAEPRYQKEITPSTVEIESPPVADAPVISELRSPSTPTIEWEELLATSGDLISAVERAVRSIDEDFAAHLRAALVAIGDDYAFLDPTAGVFQYTDAKVQLGHYPDVAAYILGLTEGLRRVVSNLAEGKGGARFRERVAVELAVAVRRKENAFAEFTPELDRIAGTRVL